MPKKNYVKLKSGTDVRGVAVCGGLPLTLTDEAVCDITRAVVIWFKGKFCDKKLKIAVGNDSRISAERIVNAVKDTLLKEGCDVIYTGLSSTPSMFMLLKKSDFGCDASVMVTASHMPYDRNGLKFFTPLGGIDGTDLDEILKIAENLPDENADTPIGNYCEKSYMDEYSRLLVEKVESECGKNPLKGKKIIVDAGNGAGGFFAEKVLKPLGADISGSQFLNPDGTFPNHIPNPEDKSAISSLSAAVIKNCADLGIIFDTDVDRAACVAENGKEINRNSLIALISAILFEEKAGVIVTDSVTSDGLKEFIESLGGKQLRYKRGYKNVIDKCRELNESGVYSPLAIETSGHAAFKENYFLDDGAYLTVKILISLAKQAKRGKSLLSLIEGLKMPAEEAELRLNLKCENFKEKGIFVIENLKEAAKNDARLTLAPDNNEGVKLTAESGRVIVRLSVHDPVMPVNFESDYTGGNRKTAQILYGYLKDYSFLDTTNLKKFLTE